MGKLLFFMTGTHRGLHSDAHVYMQLCIMGGTDVGTSGGYADMY